MCGRYPLSRRKEFLAEHFDVEPDEDWVPRYNITPSQNVPVIRQHPEEPKRLGIQDALGPDSFLGERPQHRLQND